MEKALLKVTRFNNSDVIATSGETKEDTSCSHLVHIYVTGVNANGSVNYDGYAYNNGQWSYLPGCATDDESEFSFVTKPVKDTMYGSNDAYGPYSVCNWSYPGNN